MKDKNVYVLKINESSLIMVYVVSYYFIIKKNNLCNLMGVDLFLFGEYLIFRYLKHCT